MRIRISVEGTPSELAEFCRERGIDLRLAAQSGPAAIEAPHRDRDGASGKIDKAFRKMSWETLYLAHLVGVNSGAQQDESGPYLTLEQIEALGISERQVASRAGGAKRICKRLGMSYILFSRKQPDGAAKKYYLANEAVAALRDFLDRWDFEYREYLEEAGLRYPGEK